MIGPEAGVSPRAIHHVPLRCGTLSLCVDHEDIRLQELCGYGSRRNKKRPFVFISKVLGKHYPVRPAVLDGVLGRLATKLLPLEGPAVVVGLAETATGLGQGIYEQVLLRTPRTDLLFIHTTRYRLGTPLALTFEEGHSHATEHLLHEPIDAADSRLFSTAPTLILVDDETSTGLTLANLAMAYRRLNPRLASVHIVTLTDWLSPACRTRVAAQVGVATTFHSLLRGSFSLCANAAFDPGAIPRVIGRGECKDAYLSANFGRLGLRKSLAFEFETICRAAELQRGQRLLVLGTGEFMYPPYRLARFLEERGWNVHFQATTRSPLLVGEDVSGVVEFVDNYHDEIPNYVYNLDTEKYDQILVCYETRPLPACHRLCEIIGARPLFF